MKADDPMGDWSMPAGDSQDDAALVEHAKRGEQEALRLLFRRHTPALEAFVRKRLSRAILRKVSCADILQEAFIVAVRRIGEFEDRGEGSFGRWLHRIVELKIRRAIEQYAGTAKRNPFREVSGSGRPDTRQVPGREPSPSQVAVGAEAAAAAARALLELPDDYRTVLRLLQDEDRTFEETARRMNRSLAAVRKLYARALARYAELLEVTRREV